MSYGGGSLLSAQGYYQFGMSRRGQDLVDGLVADHVARIASGLEDPRQFRSTVLSGHIQEAVRLVGMRLSSPADSPAICPLCGPRGGTFTRKGYYLHLLRVHRQELLDLVRSEALRIAGAARALGP